MSSHLDKRLHLLDPQIEQQDRIFLGHFIKEAFHEFHLAGPGVDAVASVVSLN
jgi:hypothetical protein